MWKFAKLHSDNSPMAEILSQCSDKSNLRLVIYHLSENHVECATGPNEVRQLTLTSEEARTIRNEARNGVHAILAFDCGSGHVYLIDSTPELQIASAVLLCVVTELLNGCVQPRQSQCGRPEVRMARPSIERIAEANYRAMEQFTAQRDANGRFVRKVEKQVVESNEPWKNPPVAESADTVMNRRFRLGRH
jgi:hypothetical protein